MGETECLRQKYHVKKAIETVKLGKKAKIYIELLNLLCTNSFELLPWGFLANILNLLV